mmetsp:Transcript_50965/g.129435  ORF Transcript_50965/g.129435 Transcript_50965/m.129435 type:complete len:230 (-) Transcript_50965:24-713(-)
MSTPCSVSQATSTPRASRNSTKAMPENLPSSTRTPTISPAGWRASRMSCCVASDVKLPTKSLFGLVLMLALPRRLLLPTPLSPFFGRACCCGSNCSLALPIQAPARPTSPGVSGKAGPPAKPPSLPLPLPLPPLPSLPSLPPLPAALAPPFMPQPPQLPQPLPQAPPQPPQPVPSLRPAHRSGTTMPAMGSARGPRPPLPPALPPPWQPPPSRCPPPQAPQAPPPKGPP